MPKNLPSIQDTNPSSGPGSYDGIVWPPKLQKEEVLMVVWFNQMLDLGLRQIMLLVKITTWPGDNPYLGDGIRSEMCGVGLKWFWKLSGW